MIYRKLLKPLFDFIFAVIFFIAGIPFLILLGLVYWMSYGWPIFFVQTRIGKDNRTFNLYKFRTLKSNSEENEKNTEISSLGRFLRRHSLDELPQLWNIIRGEMSFVGPRPLLVDYLPLYNSKQILRHQVKPGITGWAQIQGRSQIPWKKRLMLDLFYVEHLSFLLDMRILFKTAMLWLFQRQTGTDIGERFTGNK